MALLDQTHSLGWEAKVATLAELLNVDTQVLHRLQVGWRWGDPSKRQRVEAGSWDYPMRAGDGAVIGVHRRLAVPYERRRTDGTIEMVGKMMHRGSYLGLVYDQTSWADGTGPILMPEGMTDTATLMHLGLAAVGRPNDRARTDLMAELLRDVPADRPIVVLAEDDRKPDGRWPGVEGATFCATELARMLRRPVAWCRPADGHKDVREWWAHQHSQGVSADAAQQLLLDHIDAHMQPVDPPQQAPQIDSRLRDDIMGLDDQRAALQGALLDLVSPQNLWRSRTGRQRVRPGVHVVRSGTGVGKSHATAMLVVEAERQGLRCLILSHTHKASAERLAEARALGLQGGVCDPELNDDTCGKFDLASKARAAGLPVSGTVCLTCKLRDMCQYRGANQAAKDADVRFSTHAKGGIDLGKLTAGRDIVIIDEDLLGAVVRHAAPDPQDIELAAQLVEQAAKAAGHLCQDTLRLVEAIGLAAHVIGQAVERSTSPGLVDVDAGWVAIPTDDDAEQPRWHQLLWNMLRAGDRLPPADAMRLLMEMATGRAGEVYVTRDNLPNGLYERRVVAIDRQKVSRRRLWVTTDATASLETVQQVVGQQANDLTPGGRAPDVHQARRLVPIGGDVICGSSPKHATAVLRGVLDRVPGDRIGLLIHQKLIKPVCGRLDDDLAPEGGGLLDDHEIDRLGMASHHHGALARGSNSWLGADLTDLVVLGAPNVSPAAVRLRLLLTGQVEAARRPDGGWVDHEVLATGTDGRTVTNTCQAYSDPQWQVARGQLVHAAIRQGNGRARHTLPEGCRLWCVTAEPVEGLATDPEPVRPIEAPAHYARLVVAGFRPRQANPAKGQTSKDTISRLTFSEPVTQMPTGQVIEQLGRLGMSASTAKRALLAAEQLGLARKAGHGRWQPPGQDVPRPAVVGPAPSAPPPVIELVTGPAQPATIVVTHGLPADFQMLALAGPVPELVADPEPLEPATVDVAKEHVSVEVLCCEQPPQSGQENLSRNRDRPAPDLSWLATCSQNDFTRWHEIAAIMQHDGGLPQREAELAALSWMISHTKPAPAVDPQLQVAADPPRVTQPAAAPASTTRWRPPACTHPQHVDYPIGGSWHEDPKRPGQLHMPDATGLRRHCADCGEFLGFPRWRGKWQQPQRDHTSNRVADPLRIGGPDRSTAAHGNPWPAFGPSHQPRDRAGPAGQHRAPTGPQAAGRR
jgi:hypothetical protein